MSEVLIALLGFVGTLGAVVVTARVQRQTTERTAELTEQRITERQRIDALSALSSELMEYRRVQLHRWHEVDAARRADPDGDHESLPDRMPSAAEAREARSACWAAYYRVRLVWDDADVVDGAHAILKETSWLEHASDREHLKKRGDWIRDALGKLADTARDRLDN